MSAIETKADDEINDAVPAVLRGRLCHSPTLLKKSAGKIIDCIPILRDKAICNVSRMFDHAIDVMRVDCGRTLPRLFHVQPA